MPIAVKIVPCLADNYAYLIHDEASGETALIDAPESTPIVSALNSEGWELNLILVTHHHHDHIGGIDELRSRYGASVIGNRADSGRLPRLDKALDDGDRFEVCGESVEMVDVSGHTIGHVAYLFPGAAFTADSLMALGCGRVFEGTFEMMWRSLQKLSALPPDTRIYSGHEYTLSNGEFAMTIEPDNKELRERLAEVRELRASNLPTVPSTMALEHRTNPFLRAGLPEVKRSIGMDRVSDMEAFAEIRTRKDRF